MSELTREKKRVINLLEGPILPALSKLAVPIMATAFVQMAYNLTDMAWIGFLGSGPVAAVGAAGMFTWFSQGLVNIAKMGGQVTVAQAVGAGKEDEARLFLSGCIRLTLFLAAAFALICLLAAEPMIGFFNLSSEATAREAVIYMRITCGLIVFPFLNQTLTGIYTSVGDSKTPFFANCIGLFGNMMFDPVLIFGVGPFPEMGVAGAAAATVSAQAVVTAVLILMRKKSGSPVFESINIFKRTPRKYMERIISIGFPSSVQTMVYSSISMVLTRMAAGWGDTAVAVQRVGSQIESLAWMTGEGFGAAVNAFVAQNFGAGNLKRIRSCYRSSLIIMFIWGSLSTAVLFFGAEPLFSLFIHEPEIIPEGANYLRIISYGEMFMCLELMTVGALSGLGRTGVCSIISMSLTGARIPIAMLLSSTALMLSGIWWAFTVSSIIKGIVFTAAFLIIFKNTEKRYAVS